MRVPRYESASTLFAEKHVFNLDAICRNATFSLMERLLGSTNKIVHAVCNSEARMYSKMWKRWAIVLGVQWDHIMMM